MLVAGPENEDESAWARRFRTVPPECLYDSVVPALVTVVPAIAYPASSSSYVCLTPVDNATGRNSP